MTRPYRRGIEGVDERLRQMRFDGASVLAQSDFLGCARDVLACESAPVRECNQPIYVYIARAASGTIKIGGSIRPAERLRYSTGQYRALRPYKVLFCTVGDRRLENWLHRRFSALRVGSELYRPHGDLAAFIFELGRIAASRPKQRAA